LLVTTEQRLEEAGCGVAIAMLAPVSQTCRAGHAMFTDEMRIDIDDCEAGQSRRD
jgi:hypothetical protein